MLHILKPGKFVKLTDRITIPLAIITTILLVAGGYVAIVTSPPDYQQGESVRIMYVHVPAAWMSLFIYMVIALAGVSFLIWRNPLSDFIARAAAPIGAGFTLITLATGSIWGKVGWGTWWAWDPRIISVLLLFFLYIGYIALAGAFENQERGSKAAAILALVGAVNIPIIRFSVDWWNTLHQPASVVRLDGPAIHGDMLLPLLLMAFGFTGVFLVLLFIRVKAGFLERRIMRERMKNMEEVTSSSLSKPPTAAYNRMQ